MAKPLIISLLWSKNERVLELLMREHGYDIACFDGAMTPALQSIAAVAGCRLVRIPLEAPLDNGADAQARCDEVRHLLPEVLARLPLTAAFDARLLAGVIETRMQASIGTTMSLIDALDRLASAERIAGLVTNETDLIAAKTATLWAKARGVKTFHLNHGSNVGPAYTVTAQMPADYMLVFGERGTEPYLDIGIPREAMFITGNPAWDFYPAHLERRGEYRAAVHANLNLAAGLPTVVFATTWNAKLTALQDRDLVESTTRCFLAACRELAERGMAVNAVVKDRPSNGEFGPSLVTRLAQEEQCTNVSYADGDMPAFLCAADAFVAYDSSAFVEAMIAGVPAVGIWCPSSWLIGPALDRRDNIPLAPVDEPHALAELLQRLLGNSGAKTLVQAQAARLPYFHIANDGLSANRAAAAIAGQLTIPGQLGGAILTSPGTPSNGATRPAWHELSRPRTVAEKGGTQEYYDHARPELIDLLDHQPRVVLDIGCAGGATGLLLKSTHPSAAVHGIELNPEAATLAETRLDRVLRENVEKLDFESVGFAPGSIDAVFLPDVLEHLYDPWNLLLRLRPFLAPDAQILASIPNSRNLWLINELAGGSFDYSEEGLLDVTHIRFFTLKSVVSMFAQTGYSISRLGQNVDGRVPMLNVPPNGTIEIATARLTLKAIAPQDAWELRTLQFLVDARPVVAELQRAATELAAGVSS